jgi:hypothetical protein
MRTSRHPTLISATLIVACVLTFCFVVFYAIAEGLRADATGSGANSLPVFLGGGLGLALLIASIWYSVGVPRKQ